ncbi:hypothetical protein NQ318_005665 [Aromia moschata]|uniref:Transposase Helix-turn-helix domain-containing protein n=1 Tax=Aromia moschata TaxID=1265417 RepID=A0AAV8Y0I3_9CUCU|nr:hypothetical protein NQ318_005665 [Aromia moschata]
MYKIIIRRKLKIAFCMAVYINLKNKKKKKDVGEEMYGGSDFKNYLRTDSDTFKTLLDWVSPVISKQNTKMRESIRADERLAFTLRYLATGRSYEDLKFSTGISPSS